MKYFFVACVFVFGGCYKVETVSPDTETSSEQVVEVGSDTSPVIVPPVETEVEDTSEPVWPPVDTNPPVADTDSCQFGVVEIDELPRAVMFRKEECCGEYGSWQCYIENAMLQGAACGDPDDPDQYCAPGQACTEEGLCTCENSCQCGRGICTSFGVCIPLWCRGFMECSCWGGCYWWSEDTDETPVDAAREDDRVCCEFPGNLGAPVRYTINVEVCQAQDGLYVPD